MEPGLVDVTGTSVEHQAMTPGLDHQAPAAVAARMHIEHQYPYKAPAGVAEREHTEVQNLDATAGLLCLSAGPRHGRDLLGYPGRGRRARAYKVPGFDATAESLCLRASPCHGHDLPDNSGLSAIWGRLIFRRGLWRTGICFFVCPNHRTTTPG